jgi:hypothetical protein
MSKKNDKFENYVVRVPLPVTLCVSVWAKSKKDAIEQANIKIPLIPAFFDGIMGAKPILLYATPDGWFEYFPLEPFNRDKIFVEEGRKPRIDD